MRKPQKQKSGLAKAIGRQVALQRTRAGITQAALAERIDVEGETISRLERGSSLPSLLTLEKIALELKTSLGEMCGAAASNPADHLSQLEKLFSGLAEDERSFLMDLLHRQIAFMRRRSAR